MSRIAVLFDTTEGQTERIADYIARLITDAGHDAEFHDVRTLPPGFDLAEFDGVIQGASVHVGKHSPQATRFVQEHRQQLTAVPDGFFSVSLSAAGKTDQQQQNARRCLDEFLAQTQWQPATTATFAGALLYRQYGFLKHFLMKSIANREGGDTDTSRDYEYTDWTRVRRFAEEFLSQIQKGEPAAPR